MLIRDALRLALVGALAAGCAGELDPAIETGLPSADDILMGNRSCAEVAARAGTDLGDFELAVEGGAPGTYALDALHEVTIASEDGIHLDWAATTSIDAVLVRGGDATAVYAPGPEMLEGAGLTAPTNPKLDEPYAVSGVVFCFDHEVEVTTAASTALTRTHAWRVSNTGPRDAVTVIAGQAHWMPFTVEVARAGWTDSDWFLRGAVAITNPAPYPANVVGVEAWLGHLPVKLTCDAWLPMRLAPGATTICRYARGLDHRVDATLRAIVRTSGYEVGAGVGATAIDFDRATIKERDLRVEVWDQYDRTLGVAAGDATFVHALPIGPYPASACGTPQTFRDTAGAVALDSRTTVRSTWTVAVEVRCPGSPGGR
jgi:hypothetical protein